jgi:DNA-binding transcriptional regulator LsrR (DeoR family)
MDLDPLDQIRAIRDERAHHQQADKGLRDRMFAIIRGLPPEGVNKQDLSEASGLSRPTIYRLIEEGREPRTG